MSVVLSSSLVLSEADGADIPEGTPWIGYHDLVEVSNITSLTQDESVPALISYIANTSTNLFWRGTSTTDDEYITVTTNYVDDIDYVGIAKHNFGTAGIAVSVEGRVGADAFQKVLLHFDRDGNSPDVIVDDNEGGSAHTWTAIGNAHEDTEEYKFGGSSLKCDGTGDFVSTPDHADFNLGSADWTIHFWFNCNVATGVEGRICGQFTGAVATDSFAITKHTTNVIRCLVSNGSAYIELFGTTQFTNAINTGWHHIALVRDGNTLRLFIDGVQEDSDAFTGTVPDSTATLEVGDFGGPPGFIGWIDDFEMLVGTAKWTAAFTPPAIASPWEELVEPTVPADDSPLMMRWTPAAYTQIRVRMQPGDEAPSAAVLYVGKLLVLERSIDINPGHVPITYGRRLKVIDGLADSGDFLGRIVVGEWRESKAEFKWFTPTWWRTNFVPFLLAAREIPFFWAWSPVTYPEECGYVRLMNNAEPEVDPVTRRIAIELEMRGVV